MYEIDRKMASKLLKVSIRTVDRYISKNRLSHENREGRIWLDKKEIVKLRDKNRVDRAIDMSTVKMSIDKVDVIPVDMSIDNVHSVYSDVHSANTPKTSHERQETIEEEVYKRLFEQLQEDLKEKQSRLEGANYRVGQLEARLKDTIPLLDYNRALETERAEKERLRKSTDAQQFELEQLGSALKEERFNKKIYLIILFILLLLQPLWFLFPLK